MRLACAIAAIVLAIPAAAHHSFIAEYDATKPLLLDGTISRIDWMNPHIWIYLDVKDDKGAVVNWGCEGGTPNSLTRLGWSKDTLRPGDRVKIEGYPARDMVHTCLARAARLPDGRRLLSSRPEAAR